MARRSPRGGRLDSLSCAAILFDLDGVLVDSRECVEGTWRRWAARRELDPARVIAVAHGRRTIETVRLLAPHLDAHAEVAALESSEANTTEGVYPVPGARELVEALPPQAWAIVTSGTRPVATLRIRHANLPSPTVLVCADEIEHGKPHPEGYLTAADRLGRAPSECIVIEDTPPGLEAALAAGMRSIGVPGTFPASALTIADLVVPRLSALLVDVTVAGLFLAHDSHLSP